MQYARVLRQSAQLPVPQSEVLESLARLARPGAAQRGAAQAQDAPDAKQALLLIDQSLVSKVGALSSAPPSAVELPVPNPFP